MKKLLILILVAAALTVAGCIGVAETYTDPGQAVSIGVNQQFVIALGSNPTTGYSWQESHDQTMLELVEKDFKPADGEDVVGAGGVEYFRFKALKSGQTQITMSYQRSWEEEALEQKVFTIYVR